METFLLAQADMIRQIQHNQQQMNQRRNDQQDDDPRVATYAQFSALNRHFSQSGGTIRG
jgi:hypothetical protein